MRLTPLIGATLALALCGAAHAVPASASARFTLDPQSGLGTGATTEPGSVGHWLADNTFQASLSAAHGSAGPTDGRQLNLKSRTLDPAARAGTPFGEAAIDLPQLGGEALSAHAAIGHGSVSAAWRADLKDDEARATVNWQRPFVLNPFASVTFSGIASLMNPAASTPLPLFSEDSSRPDAYVNQASLVYRDKALSNNGINLFASIFNDNPVAAGTDVQQRTASFDDFTYGVDPFGHLSLTVHNRSGQVLYGNFELFAYSWNAAPIPEPGTVVMMLLGLAVVGVAVRRTAR